MKYIKIKKDEIEELLIEYYHFNYLKYNNFDVIHTEIKEENGQIILYVVAILKIKDNCNLNFYAQNFNKRLKLVSTDGNLYYGKFDESQIKKLLRKRYYFEKIALNKKIYFFHEQGIINMICFKGFGCFSNNYKDLDFTGLEYKKYKRS